MFLFPLFVFLSSIEGASQDSGEILNQVKETLKAGSARELANYLNQTIDIEIDGKKESYGKAQAEVILRDFFKANTPSDFSIIHKGQSKSGQSFAIGQYKSGAVNFRVFMKIKVVGNGQFIHEISFSKE